MSKIEPIRNADKAIRECDIPEHVREANESLVPMNEPTYNEINKKIAEAMGWTNVQWLSGAQHGTPPAGGHWHENPIPEFHLDANEALLAADEIVLGEKWKLCPPSPFAGNPAEWKWHAVIPTTGCQVDRYFTADNPAEAVCKMIYAYIKEQEKNK